MANDYSRIHRLLHLITLIQANPSLTARKLAEICGVSTRTIFRDVSVLERAGIPVHHDTQSGGYHIRQDFFLPPVQLGFDEALALLALAQHIGGREQIPLTRPAARAIEKIRSRLPDSVRDELVGIDEHVNIRLAPAGPHDGIHDVYETVRAAIARKRQMRCVYESVRERNDGEQDEPFLLKPYALLFGQRAWYVIGYHGGRKEIRCLKLNRFTEAKLSNQPYRIPRGFSLDDHLGNAWRMIRGDRSYQVKLHFDAEFAETIADTQWHRTQQIDWHDDGTITFRCTVDGLDEIVWWVLSMGPHCRVNKPRELAERVCQLAEHTAAQYAGQSVGSVAD